MLVYGGQLVSFNYGTYDQAEGLSVAALLYEVTTGSAVFVSTIAMADKGNGVYTGTFTPVAGKSYLVISAVYSDNTYVSLNTDRPPVAANYEASTTDTSMLNFNYAAYDFNPSLTIFATTTNVVTQTSSTGTMNYVGAGVYYARYHGAVGGSYSVLKVPTDNSRSVGVEGFQCFNIVNVFTSYQIPNATLSGQSLNTVLTGQSLNATLLET